MKYAVFIPWLWMAVMATLLLMTVENGIKLIGYIREKISENKALHTGKRFYVS